MGLLRVRRSRNVVATLPLLLVATASPASAQRSFSLEEILAYPYPTDLVTAPSGARVAWVFNEEGVRNVYGAEAPDWRARRLTSYTDDDGQELTQLAFSSDGGAVVFVRGGDHGANWRGELEPDPLVTPQERKTQILTVPFDGGEPRYLADGDRPSVSSGDVVAFERDGNLWAVPLDRSSSDYRLFFEKGENVAPVWSPDGTRLAFVSQRSDHSFIGVYSVQRTSVTYLDPSTGRDLMPRWSPDGSRIAFVRRPGLGGPPDPWLEPSPDPWEIRVADVETGVGRIVWSGPVTLLGSYPTTQGAANLRWGAADRLVFLADLDGWAHLYSVAATGGAPKLLTPHDGMAEHVSPSPDGQYLVWAGNMGDGVDDLERRHVFQVGTDGSGFKAVTSGGGNEWSPLVTGDGRWITYIGGGVQNPPLPRAVRIGGEGETVIGEERIPPSFPSGSLVTPRAVVLRASDGTEIHASVFEPAGGGQGLLRDGRRPAVLFIHGGPSRQMILGWHYSLYYANAYAMNQYLASQGYLVMAVNYRLGIGYGHDFHLPENAGIRGASEYMDIEAAGRYLAGRSDVDPTRIGLWGGSYGGYLTALGLARNSDLFAAGVDFHGVHDFTMDGGRLFGRGEWRYELDEEELKRRADLAWESSPVAWVHSWRSPVLLIHGDDDRNVDFHHTVDLARRLAAQGVPFDEIVIPDEIHDLLRYQSWLKADSATAAFFDKHFGG